MEVIRLEIECLQCGGTGVYQGMGESKGTAVVCNHCHGTGKYLYKYEYKEFTGRKINNDVKRVYKNSYGYRIGLGKIGFSTTGVETKVWIDMDKEGVSYDEFLQGKKPKHIEGLACPMFAAQWECHEIKGFTDECGELNGGYIQVITNCKNKINKKQCWERFNRGVKK